MKTTTKETVPNHFFHYLLVYLCARCCTTKNLLLSATNQGGLYESTATISDDYFDRGGWNHYWNPKLKTHTCRVQFIEGWRCQKRRKMEEKDAYQQKKNSNLCINQGPEFKLGFCECSFFFRQKNSKNTDYYKWQFGKRFWNDFLERLKRGYCTQRSRVYFEGVK